MRTYLFHQQFPVDAHRCPTIFLAVLTQTTRKLAHALQAVSTVEEVLDILGHDLGDITKLVVQLIQVTRGTAILIQLLCALNKGIEFDEGIRAKGG